MFFTFIDSFDSYDRIDQGTPRDSDYDDCSEGHVLSTDVRHEDDVYVNVDDDATGIETHINVENMHACVCVCVCVCVCYG